CEMWWGLGGWSRSKFLQLAFNSLKPLDDLGLFFHVALEVCLDRAKMFRDDVRSVLSHFGSFLRFFARVCLLRQIRSASVRSRSICLGVSLAGFFRSLSMATSFSVQLIKAFENLTLTSNVSFHQLLESSHSC